MAKKKTVLNIVDKDSCDWVEITGIADEFFLRVSDTVFDPWPRPIQCDENSPGHFKENCETKGKIEYIQEEGQGLPNENHI